MCHLAVRNTMYTRPAWRMACTLLFERLSTTSGGSPLDGTTVTGGVSVGAARAAGAVAGPTRDAARTSQTIRPVARRRLQRDRLPGFMARPRYRAHGAVGVLCARMTRG